MSHPSPSPKPIVETLDAPPEPYQVNANRQYTIGDLHGNFIKAIHFLIKEGILVLSEDSEQAKWLYKELRQLYLHVTNPLHVTYTSPLIDAHDIARIKFILANAKLNPVGCIRFIGDELGDRGRNDYFMLLLIKRISESNIPFHILSSNHGMGFLGDQLQLFPKGKSSDISRTSLSKSMHVLSYLKQKKLVSQEEIDELVEMHYLNKLRLIDYSLSEDKKHLSIYTHAPVDLLTVIKAAEYYHIPVETPLDVHEMTQLIDEINLRFHHQLQQNQLYESYRQQAKLHDEDAEQRPARLKNIVSHRHPLYRLCWTRDPLSMQSTHAEQQYAKLIKDGAYTVEMIHGHNGEDNLGLSVLLNKQLAVINIDTNLGKGALGQGTYYIHRRKHPTNVEADKAIRRLYQDIEGLVKRSQQSLYRHHHPFASNFLSHLLEQPFELSRMQLILMVRWVNETMLNTLTASHSDVSELIFRLQLPDTPNAFYGEDEGVSFFESLQIIYYQGQCHKHIKEFKQLYEELALKKPLSEEQQLQLSWYIKVIHLLEACYTDLAKGAEFIAASNDIIEHIININDSEDGLPDLRDAEVSPIIEELYRSKEQIIAERVNTKHQELYQRFDEEVAVLQNSKTSEKPLLSVHYKLSRHLSETYQEAKPLLNHIQESQELTSQQKLVVFKLINDTIFGNGVFDPDYREDLIYQDGIRDEDLFDSLDLLLAKCCLNAALKDVIDMASKFIGPTVKIMYPSSQPSQKINRETSIKLHQLFLLIDRTLSSDGHLTKAMLNDISTAVYQLRQHLTTASPAFISMLEKVEVRLDTTIEDITDYIGEHNDLDPDSSSNSDTEDNTPI